MRRTRPLQVAELMIGGTAPPEAAASRRHSPSVAKASTRAADARRRVDRVRGTRRPKRVLMVSSVFPNREEPAFGTFVAERARAWARRAEVRVVAPIPWFPSWARHELFGRWGLAGRVGETDSLDGVEVLHPRRIVIPKIGDVSSGALYARALRTTLRRLHRRFPFELIDTHFLWPDGYATTLVGRELGIPVTVTAQGTDLNLVPSLPSLRPQVAQTIQRAARVITVSSALAEIARELGCPSNKLRVVPPGVDPARFPLLTRRTAQSELGLAPRGEILLCVASLIPRKGHRVLFEALRKLRAGAHPHATLFLIGEGPERGALSELARRLELREAVRMVGSVPHEHIATWMNAAHVLCLASTREGWPTVFLEGLACGAPIVATDAHGARECLASLPFGFVVPRDDPARMAAALHLALKVRWNRRRIRAHATLRTWDRVAEESFAVFEEALAATAS